MTSTKYWGEFTNGHDAIFPAMDAAIAAIIAGLNGYGQMVDQVMSDLREALTEAALEAGGEELVAILADLATDGFAAVLTGPESEVIAARAASHLHPVIQRLVGLVQAAADIQDVKVAGRATLAASIAAMPQPDLAQQAAWQTGDDVYPANSPYPRDSFGSDETNIASYLQGPGHDHVVTPVYENPKKMGYRNVDSLVDGQPVEFKTLDAPTGLNGIRNNLQSSQKGTGQSDEIVIDTRKSQAPDMTKSNVEQQLQQYFSGARSKTNGNVQRVTVILPDGTTTTWPPGYGGL
ncbi:MAG TPA: hypothetical protein VG247_17200 [Pseudonocardiaceae bacterium]|jgi:hypothetical protein|nr:hypothetical protein [Pseudonocardiaceae bacterium]